MFTDNETIRSVPSIQLNLDDLHRLLDLLMDSYNEYPNAYDKALAAELLSLWTYHSRKTKNTANYFLTVKK